jgi:hypothetical protein
MDSEVRLDASTAWTAVWAIDRPSARCRYRGTVVWKLWADGPFRGHLVVVIFVLLALLLLLLLLVLLLLRFFGPGGGGGGGWDGGPHGPDGPDDGLAAIPDRERSKVQ